MCGKHHNAEALTGTYHRLDEIQTIGEEETTHCRNVLRSDNHCKTQRYSSTVQNCMASNKSKQPNAYMKITVVGFAPLLVGKVQIGLITNVQC